MIELHPHVNSNNAMIRTSDETTIPNNPAPKKCEKVIVNGRICRWSKT